MSPPVDIDIPDRTTSIEDIGISTNTYQVAQERSLPKKHDESTSNKVVM